MTEASPSGEAATTSSETQAPNNVCASIEARNEARKRKETTQIVCRHQWAGYGRQYDSYAPAWAYKTFAAHTSAKAENDIIGKHAAPCSHDHYSRC